MHIEYRHPSNNLLDEIMTNETGTQKSIIAHTGHAVDFFYHFSSTIFLFHIPSFFNLYLYTVKRSFTTILKLTAHMGHLFKRDGKIRDI